MTCAPASDVDNTPPRKALRADLQRGLRLLVAIREAGLGPETEKAADRWMARYVREIRAREVEHVSIDEARRLAG